MKFKIKALVILAFFSMVIILMCIGRKTENTTLKRDYVKEENGKEELLCEDGSMIILSPSGIYISY